MSGRYEVDGQVFCRVCGITNRLHCPCLPGPGTAAERLASMEAKIAELEAALMRADAEVAAIREILDRMGRQ